MGKQRKRIEKILQERWEQIQKDDMCSRVWRSFSESKGFYGIAFDSPLDNQQKDGFSETERKELYQLQSGYVKIRGSFWKEGQNSPIYEDEALVFYGVMKEELTTALRLAGYTDFLYCGQKLNNSDDGQSMQDLKLLIADFFVSQAKRQGVDLEGFTLFRLQERVITHLVMASIAARGYWTTFYENGKPEELLQFTEYNPDLFLSERQQNIRKNIGSSVVWGALLDNDQSVGVIATQKGRNEDLLRHIELKRMIRVREHPFIEFLGGIYSDDQKDFPPIYEAEIVLIFGITKKTLMHLAERLRHKLVLYCDKTEPQQEFHILSVEKYYDRLRDCSVKVYRQQRNAEPLGLAKTALKGFISTLAERQGTSHLQSNLLRLHEEIVLPRLHRYNVLDPLMIVCHEEKMG